jgi:hypothetical protein
VFRKNVKFSFIDVSLLLLLYVFLPSFLLSVFLLLRTASPAAAYGTSLCILGGLILLRRKETGWRECLCFVAIVVVSHLVSYIFFDFFHDALVYHQPAISRIAAGFNPVYDGYMSFGRPHDTWSDQATYFPRMAWYFAASVTAVFGDIQWGKAYHLILLFATVLFVFHHTRGESFLRRFFWLLAALNPIAALQFTGYLVDGALASLSTMGLFYAYLHFSEKPLTRLSHVIGVLCLAMLFCVKTSGFAYGGIILFCIALHRLLETWRASSGNWKARGKTAFMRAAKLSLKLGVPLLCLVVVLGFSPYITNLLQGKNIFYPLMGVDASADSNVSLALEELARSVFPDAHNRFTRLLFSIASYPVVTVYPDTRLNALFASPAELKNPLGAPWIEWKLFRGGGLAVAGGLGPLFFLLFLLSFIYWIFSLTLKNGERKGWVWMLFTLGLLLFIQPHAWFARYAPFLWMTPFVFCLSLPREKDYLLVAPIILALANIAGTTWVYADDSWENTRRIVRALAPYSGQYVLLDKSVFQCDGFFDRFGIKQKFANPEQTTFPGASFWTERRERHLGRPVFGSNIAFEEDIPPLPDFPVLLAEKEAEPWRKMAEGIMLYDPSEQPTLMTISAFPVPKGCWNYSNKVKFYVQVKERPETDRNFLLTASPRVDEKGDFAKQSIEIYANNQRIGEWLFDRPEPEEKTVLLPRKILEESYEDEMHLLTVMLRLTNPDVPKAWQEFSLMFEKMEFRPIFQIDN